MNRISKLLVVDDEEVICQGCRRIFSPQGFQVETSSDPREALSLACGEDYDAVLLDVKMPRMNGIQFLQQFRIRKPAIPVILITGYPSVPDAAEAMRLGATDYITKPFTPEEITRAVRRTLRQPEQPPKEEAPAAPTPLPPWETPKADLRFVGESWMEPGEGAVRVGALVAPSEGAAAEAILLPRVGDVVYQGLPLAALTLAGKTTHTFPSPVSGVVAAVNTKLRDRFAALWEDPFREGWIASISPTRMDQELSNCRPRRIILANADPDSARAQRDRLTALGCQVRVVDSWDELAPTLPDPECRVLMLDADSLGPAGPDLAAQVRRAAPSMRVVVVASASSPREAEYRKHGIFYYSLAPFADDEIVEVLGAVFRPQQRSLAQDDRTKPASDPVSSIFITNRNGKQVGLFVAGGLFSRNDGLGWHVRQKLLDRLYPMRTTAGIGQITQVKVLLAASMCDRLILLVPKDMGRLPGSLARDTTGRFVSVPAEPPGKVTALVVQPAAPGTGLRAFDEQTLAALAQHVACEMEA